MDSTSLQTLHAWWRAANYLSVGQIYLLANPLLREPLRREHIKPRLQRARARAECRIEHAQVDAARRAGPSHDRVGRPPSAPWRQRRRAVRCARAPLRPSRRLRCVELGSSRCPELETESGHADVGFDVRVTRIGHVQRGGAPNAFDRILASRTGAAAIEALAHDRTDILVGIAGGEICETPLAEVVGRIN